MTGAESNEALMRRLTAESARMREALASVAMSWAGLENSLAWLLKQLIRGDGDDMMALAIYYAPNNTETRLRVVDAAFRHSRFPGVGDRAVFLACFTKILSRISKAKEKRNAVTHGNVCTVGDATKQAIRLTGAIFDIDRQQGPLPKGTFPGMSPHDVEQVAMKISACSSEVHELGALVEMARDIHAPVFGAPDMQVRRALNGRLRQLAERLNLAGLPPSGPRIG